MTFVTADSCRPQLENLTKLLVSTFPGSTIYQHNDPFRMIHDALSHEVDAVFLGANADKPGDLELIKMLRRQKPDLPAFVLSQTDELCSTAAEAGATGYFVLPLDKQQLLDAMQSVKDKECLI